MTLPDKQFRSPLSPFSRRRPARHPACLYRAPFPLSAGHPRSRLGLGLIMSHAANLPLFGVARVDCAGACKCSCEVADGADCLVDTLSNGTRVTVTDYTRVLIVPRALSAAGAGKADRVGRMCGEGADPTAMCIVRVRNTRVQGARARVAVRSLTFGINDYRTNFKLAASVRRA